MTRLTRRAFNASLMAGLAAGHRATADDVPSLIAAPGKAQLAPADYPETAIWGYGGTVPGPTIRLRQNQTLTRRFVNNLPQPSTVHWHGIRIANAMDGVAGMTQDPVAPGQDFLYDFTLPDAGTYWYHPHNRTWEQMARGLYGALIVEEPEGAPDVDQDEVLLIDDWRLSDDAQIAEGFGNLHDWSHGGRIGNWITVNGQPAWSKQVERFQRLRLRLVNTSNARVLDLSVKGLEGWVMALDGMPLATPLRLDRLTLAPAQRVDVIVDVTAEAGGEAFLVSHERDGGFAIAAFSVEDTTRDMPLPAPDPLPANNVAALGSLDSAHRVELVMEGGAMGGMQTAMLDGRETSIRDLAQAGKVWAFNGRVDMPDKPLVSASAGETLRIAMRNDTRWPHAMHLHGHHFRVIGDGAPGPLRDTVLVQGGETVEIAFVADNPGDWLLHCHMLEHSAAGMMTWLRVS